MSHHGRYRLASNRGSTMCWIVSIEMLMLWTTSIPLVRQLSPELAPLQTTKMMLKLVKCSRFPMMHDFYREEETLIDEYA